MLVKINSMRDWLFFWKQASAVGKDTRWYDDDDDDDDEMMTKSKVQ